MSATPSEASLAMSAAAHESWARTPDRAARTAAGRAAMLAKFEDEVDPDRTMTPAARAKAAESARKAYFTRLALQSARTRRLRREAEQAAAKLEEMGGGDAA
ncbi:MULTISPECIES: hypothetical protein [Gordonia]|uniref:Uncharacterized protein n=1 Tax=Gordonia amicalis TaxID=89053 RepID=A0AAE4U855_9ACTN|nr:MULTISPECIES: hypothetical protein [Gordonia]ATD69183.1 hypothetical protein CNO18_01550 [Gordonia sp. 1D]MCZ4654228.1 hypothetical protein [Gordonia amicalis]MDJ0452117.1 hypothetical protein [Gordonia amicalis]MDV6308188.1 hypothetical protein [Gordonia amicalis]MDV6312001.1 hypothetical protein [Gordonia amicalis]